MGQRVGCEPRKKKMADFTLFKGYKKRKKRGGQLNMGKRKERRKGLKPQKSPLQNQQGMSRKGWERR